MKGEDRLYLESLRGNTNARTAKTKARTRTKSKAEEQGRKGKHKPLKSQDSVREQDTNTTYTEATETVSGR
jgi:hypothetical protein